MKKNRAKIIQMNQIAKKNFQVAKPRFWIGFGGIFVLKSCFGLLFQVLEEKNIFDTPKITEIAQKTKKPKKEELNIRRRHSQRNIVSA